MISEAENIDLHPVAQSRGAIDQVPVVDLSELVRDSSAAAAQGAIDQIASACKSWGFFQVVNHGIPSQQVREVWQQAHAFFHQPLAAKLEVERSRENPWGFYHRELTKNQRDKKEVFDFTRAGVDPIYRQRNRWPAKPAGFESTMMNYLDACTGVALKLLEGFCLGLDLPPQYLHPHFVGNHTGFIRLNYYPVEDTGRGQGEAEADLGIHHHADAGVLTVLLQDEVGGLQVYRDGFWYDIPTQEGAMVINTGDMMQVWSNDIYKAAIHRVLAMRSAQRFSIPFFFNPSADSRVSPLPSVIDDEEPAHYRDIPWSEFRGKRTDGDFADYGAEVQISQYRL
ncbi:MAG: 2-oxoglutarate and iron-dependent oxygenase domain-containing protein [Gammaproteobacteria bacterium]|nr:2-oxoglutarate and iron-dependent oxygenase domain-containing protein [Gammaproteobacteria bacterium]